MKHYTIHVGGYLNGASLAQVLREHIPTPRDMYIAYNDASKTIEFDTNAHELTKIYLEKYACRVVSWECI